MYVSESRVLSRKTFYFSLYVKERDRGNEKRKGKLYRHCGKGSPKTIKYNSGLRITYLVLRHRADDTFRQVRVADFERNIVSQQDYRRKKSDDVIRGCSDRDQSSVRTAIPWQRDRK